MQDTCSRVHSHGHAPAGCMQGACLACLVLVRAHRERLRVCLQLARLRARNARAHTVTCAYALRFLPSVRCLCARPQCGVLSPRARQTTSFTCWSVVSLYRILSRFSFDSSSSSSSGSNVSSTKSAAPACTAVAAPAERSAADRTPRGAHRKARRLAHARRTRAGRRAEASQGSALELEGVGARRERQCQEQQEACSAPPPGEAVTWRWGNHDARRGASSPRREPSTHAAAHTARTTHRVPHACHASPFTQLSPPRTCPRGPPCAGGFRHPGLSARAGTRDVTNHNALSVL